MSSRRNYPQIHVMHRPGKLGLGTAMLEAISFAVGNQYDYLLNLDADFSHPPGSSRPCSRACAITM